MIGNIKETFPPKTGMQKKQVLQDPGYVNTVEAMLQSHMSHPNVKWYICQCCWYVQLNYNEDPNTMSSNYMKVQLKALYYFESQQTSKRILQITDASN